MSSTDNDLMAWLEQQTAAITPATPSVTATVPVPLPTPTPVAAMPAAAVPVATPTITQSSLPPRSGNGVDLLKFMLIIANLAVLVTVLIILLANRTSKDDGVDPDVEPKPKPVQVNPEVVSGIQGQMSEFIIGMSDDWAALNKRVSADDINTIQEWLTACQTSFTDREDKFIQDSGELGDKHLPPGSLDDINKELTEEQLAQLRSYNQSISLGLRKAVTK